MLPEEIVPGLLRWSAPHPEWVERSTPAGPDDWGQMVGSVLYEVPPVVVLIDPLLPTDGRAEFLAWLDERVAGRPVSILTTIRWHRRDRKELARRYAAGTSPRAWNAIPPGVQPRPLRGAGEIVMWLPGAAALVCGDCLIAGGGRLSVCPESWLADQRVDRQGLAALMLPLLELPIERVLVSHGEPVLHDGRAALSHALREASGD